LPSARSALLDSTRRYYLAFALSTHPDAKMLKKSDPKFTLETIVGRMRAGARRATAEETATGSESGKHFVNDRSQFAGGEIAPIVLQPSFQAHNDDHYHVDDLLKYHDRAFLQNAYRAILKRGPDATGFNSFINAMRSGRFNKIDVLARLRFSPEGRAKQVRIDGLLLPASVRLLYGLPVLGYILNVLVGLVRLPNSIRNEQQFQAHVLAQQEIIAEHTNHVGKAVSSLSAELGRTFSRSLQGLSDLHRQQIDALTSEQTQQREVVAGEQQATREELRRRLSELNERFEEAIQAQQAYVFSQLSHFSKDFEAALTGEKASREESLDRLRTALESAQRTGKQDFDQLSRALRDEQAARESNLEQLTRALGNEQGAREAALDGLQQALTGEQKAREDAFHSLSQQLICESTRAQSEATRLEDRLVALNDGRQKEDESFRKELAAEVQKLFQRQQEARAELVLQNEVVTKLLDEARRRLIEPLTPGEAKSLAEEADFAFDAFYLSLEDQFRGPRREVKQRLRAYLPLIREAHVGGAETPILDVGCGRGEWLSLLSHEGLTASGVDSNRMMIQLCKKLKLNVTEADLVDHLQSLPDASLGALTGFHIVEHLSIEKLVRFLNEALRVVKPGGLVIFETPNPQNVLVGTCNFYFDPTHRNPLPSPVMKFLLESRGFTGVEVLNLNPSDEAPVAGDGELVRRFNQYFYGPMDYAVVGKRP
jgi:O-antigen chain-terminating methyltransferase